MAANSAANVVRLTAWPLQPSQPAGAAAAANGIIAPGGMASCPKRGSSPAATVPASTPTCTLTTGAVDPLVTTIGEVPVTGPRPGAGVAHTQLAPFHISTWLATHPLDATAIVCAEVSMAMPGPGV